MTNFRRWTGTPLCVLFALLACLVLLGTVSPALATEVAFTAEEDPEEAELQQLPNLWSITASLDAPFSYPIGYGISIEMPLDDRLDIINIFGPPGPGWWTLLLIGSPDLGEDAHLIDLEATADSPGPELAFWWWTRTDLAPEDIELTSRWTIYDTNTQTVESGSSIYTIPEPANSIARLAALLVLAMLATWQRGYSVRRGLAEARGHYHARGPRIMTSLLAVVIILGAFDFSAAAVDIEKELIFTRQLGNVEVTFQPVRYTRENRWSFLYDFDVSVKNEGATTQGSFTLGAQYSQECPYPASQQADNRGVQLVTSNLSVPSIAALQSTDLAEDLQIRKARHTDLLAGGSFYPFEQEHMRLCMTLDQPLETDAAIPWIEDFITQQGLTPGQRTNLPHPNLINPPFDCGRTYTITIEVEAEDRDTQEITNLGTMTFELFPAEAPLHVTNIMYLSLLDFYDGLEFHRVISGFMAQGGWDEVGGGPGFSFGGECNDNLQHGGKGKLSAANTGAVGSDGSQFFILFAAAPWLNRLHTVYGDLVAGVGVLDTIQNDYSTPNPGVPTAILRIVDTTLDVQ